jgi:hypothetical protein
MRLVEGLIAFRIFVPAYLESRALLLGILVRVSVNRVKSFGRRELHLQPLLGILTVFQAPTAHARRRRASEIAIQILQVLVAKQDFRPLAAVLFKDGRSRD